MEPGDVCQMRPYPKSQETVPRTYEEMASNGGHLIPWIALAFAALLGAGVIGSMVNRARKVRLPTEAEVADFMQKYNETRASLERMIETIPGIVGVDAELAAVRTAAHEVAEQNGFRIDGSTATLL